MPPVPVELSVTLDDVAIPKGPADSVDDPAAAPRVPVLQQEMVMLDSMHIVGTADVVILVPFKFRDGQNQAVAAIIRIRKGSASDPKFGAACELATRQMADAYHGAQDDAKAHPAATSDMATVYGGWREL